MSDLIGFLGGLCFTLSVLPLAYQSIRVGTTDLPWTSIILVCLGALGMGIHGIYVGSYPVMADMIICFTCWFTIGVVKCRTVLRNSTQKSPKASD